MCFFIRKPPKKGFLPKYCVHKDTARYVLSYSKPLELLLSVKSDFSKISISNNICIILFFIHTQKCNFSATLFWNTLLCQRLFPIKLYFCSRKRRKSSLKSATKPFNILLACTCPLLLKADKLRQKHPNLPTIPPYPTMRLETIRSIIPISLGVIQNQSGIHLRKHCYRYRYSAHTALMFWSTWLVQRQTWRQTLLCDLLHWVRTSLRQVFG